MVLPAIDLESERFQQSSIMKSNDLPQSLQTPAKTTQVLLAIVCAMVHMGVGTILSFSGVTLPQLLYVESMSNLTQMADVIEAPLLNNNQAAFFSSASLLGAAIGSSMSGPLMVVMGPRTTLLTGIPLTLLMWIVLSVTDVIPVLLGVRLLQGIAMGIMSLGASLFVVEVAHFSIRGPLSAALDLARNFGVLLMFGIGSTKIWWRYQAAIVAVLTTVPGFILLLFLKNSPRWLAMKGKSTDAHEALKFYRGSNYPLNDEYENIVDIARNESKKTSGLKDQMLYMMNPKILKVLFLCITYAIATQLTGTFAIIAYAVPVLKNAVPTVDPYIGTIFVGVFRVFGGVLFMSSSRYVGRSKTYLLSSLLCSISLIFAGIHMYLESKFLTADYLWWVPIFFILLFTTSVAIALPVAGLQVVEILPLNCRALAYGIIDIVFYGSAFVVSITFPYISGAIEIYGAFWLYGIFSFIFAWMPILCLPETLGRHLEDIEKSLLHHDENVKGLYGSFSTEGR